MGQTGFCENLRFPAVFCENLRLRNAVLPRKSENQQQSAKICKKTANLAPLVPFSLSLLILLEKSDLEFRFWNGDLPQCKMRRA